MRKGTDKNLNKHGRPIIGEVKEFSHLGSKIIKYEKCIVNIKCTSQYPARGKMAFNQEKTLSTINNRNRKTIV